MRRFLVFAGAWCLACAAGKDAPSDDGEVADDTEATEDDELEGDDAEECADGADNDRDGDFDCDDAGCDGSPDCTSLPETLALSFQERGASLQVLVTGTTQELQLGITEVDGEDPWTGEDCYRGYTLGGGDEILVCHTVTGGSADLEIVQDVHDVSDGYTLFLMARIATAAVVLLDPASDDCWTDHAYYADLGCGELLRD